MTENKEDLDTSYNQILLNASGAGNLEICRSLCSPEHRFHIFKATLHLFLKSEKCAMIIFDFIRPEVDLDFQNADGQTPLILSCFGKHMEVAQLLLQSDADINKTDKSEFNVLQQACCEVTRVI
jgi:ankyrin repeat protein